MIVVGTFMFGILVGCFIERHRLGLTSWSHTYECEPSESCFISCPSSHYFSCKSARVPSRRWRSRRRSLQRIPRPCSPSYPQSHRRLKIIEPWESDQFTARHIELCRSKSRCRLIRRGHTVNSWYVCTFV
jgi:hypothetical protein